MGVRRFVEDPAPARLRAGCWAVFFAPFVVFAGVEAGSRMLGSASSGLGTFVPAPEAMLLSILGAALYAAAFTFLLARLRRHLAEDFFPRWRGKSTSRQSPWVMGAILFGLVGMLSSQVLCGAINRAIGQVTYESWRVRDKGHDLASRDCEFRVSLESRATDDSARVCMPRERWEQMHVDDSLTITAIFSGLGEQVGPAPDADGKEGGR